LDTEYFLFLFVLMFCCCTGFEKKSTYPHTAGEFNEWTYISFSSVEPMHKVKYPRTMNDNIQHLLTPAKI